MKSFVATSVALVLAASTASASAAVYDLHPGDDLFARLAMLAPGDVVVVHAGTYTTPGFLQLTLAGTADALIDVHGAPGEARPVIMGDPSQNVINLDGTYFAFNGFEIRGGSHGLRLGTVDHAHFENNVFHDLGDVGISCNRDGMGCTNITIEHNEIYDTGHAGTGEGMYLGCNDGGCTFANALILNNYVHDLGGDQGDGIEVKTGAHDVTVRDNVIVRAKYPGITMYGFSGAGGNNVVEGNLIWHTQDNGIQIVGQVAVTNNLIIDAGANGIQSKSSQALLPHDLSITHNTIVGAAGGACMKANDWGAATQVEVANNALYCGTTAAINVAGGQGAALFHGNIGLGTSTVTTGFTAGVALADLGDPAANVYYPPTGSPLINAGDPAFTSTFDFNHTMRDAMPDVGAYEHTDATNPGWKVTEGFKTTPADPSGDGVDGDTTCIDPCTPIDKPGGCCEVGSDPASAWLLAGAVLALRSASRRRRAPRPRA